MTQTLLAREPTQSAQPRYVITEEDKKRQQAIAFAWKAYDGDFEPQLEKTPEGIDPNVVMNQCSPLVDGGIDFLFGQEIEISVEKDAPSGAQDVLDSAWGIKEERIPLLQDLAMNGALARNAFLRIVPDGAGAYELVPIDPSTVCVQTAPQNCNKVLLYCIQYSETSDAATGGPREVYYREEISANYPDTLPGKPAPPSPTSWQIGHWTHIGQKGAEPKLTDWTSAGPPIVWNYPFPPLFHCKNLPRPNEFWGRADLRDDIIGMNRSLNLDLSCVMLDEILNGQPILYANGVGQGKIDRKAGSIIQLDLVESKISAVAIPTDIPGALAVANDLRSSIDETSGFPGVATGRIKDMPRGNLSGIAIELLFMRPRKQNDKKRCLYGKLIIDVSQALLVLAGYSPDIKITLAWENPLPHDDLPSVQAAISKLELDISKTTLQREIGYDPEEEAKLKADEEEVELAKAQAKAQAIAEALPTEEPFAPQLPGQQKPMPPQPGVPVQPLPTQGGKP